MTSAVVDVFLTYQFIKRLVMPYEQWPAYKEGIIDKDGKVLIKRKDFKTGKQRNAFRLFDLLTLNLKKLLGKLPGGQSKIATYAAALYLLKESQNITEDNIETLEEDFLKFMAEHEQEILSEMFIDEADPKVGTGKKPKGSGRRLYTDENPKDTVRIKFATPADAKATVSKVKNIKKPYARKIQILTVGEQRAKVMGKSEVVNIFKKAKEDLKAAEMKKRVDEDAPTNSTAGIAGIRPDSLKVSPKAVRRYKQQNANTTSQLVKMVRRRMNNA